jgi:hypothetical protein
MRHKSIQLKKLSTKGLILGHVDDGGGSVLKGNSDTDATGRMLRDR